MNDYQPDGGYIDLTKLKTTDNSLMWYAALLPVFGLVFEIYADSIALGAFLWLLIIAVRIFVCIYDNKQLIHAGLRESSRINPTVFFPVVYIVKRAKTLKRSTFIGGLAASFMFFAITGNGFARSLSYDEDDYCSFVSEYYAEYITNLPEDENYTQNPYLTIGELISRYCIGSSTAAPRVEYRYEQDGSGSRYVYATSVSGGDEYCFEFLLDYDGYSYQGCELQSVLINGEKLSESDTEALMKEAFMIDLSEEEE